MRIPFLEKSYIIDFYLDDKYFNIILKINRFKDYEIVSIAKNKIKKLYPNFKSISITNIKSL